MTQSLFLEIKIIVSFDLLGGAFVQLLANDDVAEGMDSLAKPQDPKASHELQDVSAWQMGHGERQQGDQNHNDIEPVPSVADKLCTHCPVSSARSHTWIMACVSRFRLLCLCQALIR